MRVTVYYEDTDATGLVFHPNYLKYCDRARAAHFFNTDTALQGADGHLIVHSLACRYLTPARLGDVLDVSSNITKIKRTSLKIEQTISRGKKPIFTVQLTMLYVRNMRPSLFPEEMLRLFHTIEKELI
ncbi:YbgC/FadM family acyl-CoA thioesterase [Sulfurimonas sp. HSL-3221]|uniref:YbgC/FadM family acyl-CoA thioesterase n=1 Tax=Sulfurimonadaceae TaxID=2771471 RepID=UPI001E3475FF|nr:YbgC/FadM family acyl-CoA thioesterase [Sulfurimonas sp. HSL-3221]UFS63232.1 YbgC/FadM family acyl-CoA thioesterase [Sulfurimonas sp. HSL-3221]